MQFRRMQAHLHMETTMAPEKAAELREELKALMKAAGEPPAEIEPVKHYP